MTPRISSQEIRQLFLRFFEKNGHMRIPGASLLPQDDPTLLFINSGMAPLKKYFTGEVKPPSPDLCNIQRVIRTKDIEEIGDRHHLTFFEMLGSWSINHYFKERAIELAYELLVDVLSFDPSKLYATVFQGDAVLGLPPDDVSPRVWERLGLAADHVVPLGKDNLWGPAGDTGPCGPCTEVFYDTGEQYGDAYRPGGHFDTTRRYIEIWNAGVFMEFNKTADGRFEKLPFRSVDTGSGLERMTMIMNGLENVYETDLVRPSLDLIQEMLKGASGLVARDSLLLADHVRAAVFILADGVFPSNEGAGYIPRRLIRRSIGKVSQLGVKEFDFAAVIHHLVQQYSTEYGHLIRNENAIVDAFTKEMNEFGKAVDKGLQRADALCKKSKSISGRDAFELFSTYGMPLDMLGDYVEKHGGSVDEIGFQEEFRRHQDLSRGKPGVGSNFQKILQIPAGTLGAPTVFDWSAGTGTTAIVVGIFRNALAVESVGAGDVVDLVLNRTVFYAEGGGQIGDTGSLASDGVFVDVVGTTKSEDYQVHHCVVKKGRLVVGAELLLRVEEGRRRKIAANHSGTHLLHSALRRVLGKHVRQAGSLVDDEKLRFDFEHSAKVSPQELASIERLVNIWVSEDLENRSTVTSYSDAVNRGALAFFGDSYGEQVRLVEFGDVSAELCGGTHVSSTGAIGLMRVVSEGSVASGIRRITAYTGMAAVDYTLARDSILTQVSMELKTRPEELLSRVRALRERPSLPSATQDQPVLDVLDLAMVDRASKTSSGGIRYFGLRRNNVSPSRLKDEALQAADQLKGVALLATADADTVRLVVAVAKSLKDVLDASAILSPLMSMINGQGGGTRHLAQGGGNDPSALDQVLNEFPRVLERI